MGIRDAFQPLLARAERALSDGVERALFALADRVPTGAKLLTEQGQPLIGGVRAATRTSQADNLSPERLGTLLRAADAGNVEAYLTLAEEMEERDGHYRSVLSTRKLAVVGAPLLVESASDSKHDKVIAEDVEQLVRRAEFEGLITDLMDAPAKGFACVEILWDRTVKRWEPKGYAHRPARHFLFDDLTMERPLLRSLEQPQGEELMPYSWIVHKPRLMSGVPIRAGLARPVAWLYAAKHLTVVDWLQFLEVYGMPIRIGKYPAAMESKKKELLKAVRSIGSDAAGVIPLEMEIQMLEAKGSQGADLFENTARFLNQEMSKVVLGQTMTAEDGSSLAQAEVHQRVRFDIRDADARAVSASINRDLIRPFVILNYGQQEQYPRVLIKTVEKEDTKALIDTAQKFVNLGGKVQMSEVRDRLGFAEPEGGAELLEPEAAINARHAPKPPPAPPGTPGAPGAPGAASSGKPAKPASGKKPEPGEEPDPPETKEANRQRFARKQGAEDVVDELADEALEDWRPLLAENVGQLIARAQAAETWEEARALLDQLADDAGDELPLGLITAQLARLTFQVRGIGDATDRTEGL